jgi:hypothetical protein
MSCIVYQINKKTGVKYAYESVSYWDKEKQQPRSTRKYVGRVDPETGEIIKSRGKRDSSSNNQSEGSESVDLLVYELQQEVSQKDAQIAALSKELALLTSNYEKAQELLKQIASLANVSAEDTDV